MRLHIITLLSSALALSLPPEFDARAGSGPAAYVPVPYLPGRTVEFRSNGVDLAGSFTAADGACQISLRTTATTGGAVRFDAAVPAGSKRQFPFDGLSVEAYCCPQLRMMTLRALKPAAPSPTS
jgi:hypothetical protein